MEQQKTKRQLPIYTIQGTVFNVDIQEQQLVERANPDHTISFIDQMTDLGSHYELAYVEEIKNTIDPANNLEGTENWSVVRIPKLIELDPEGMAEKYGYSIADLPGKTDFEVIVDQQLLAARKNGILPKIFIGEDRFHILLKDHELLPAGHRGASIQLDDLKYNDDTQGYEGYYHAGNKRIVRIDPKLTEFPDHIVAIRIPHRLDLDPVFAAMIYGMNERKTLRRHPIKKELKAELISLSETHIPSLIQRNREQLQQEHRENAQRAKPGNRHKI